MNTSGVEPATTPSSDSAVGRRIYVFSTRGPLPVPEEGWSLVRHPPDCGAPELTCNGVECHRATTARFFATARPDTDLVDSVGDVFKAGAALLSDPGSPTYVPVPELPAEDFPRLRPVLTVSAPYPALREADDPQTHTDRLDAAQVADASDESTHFEECLTFLIDGARALILASETLAAPLSLQQLGPTYLVIDEDVAGTRSLTSVELNHATYLGPQRATRAQADRATSFALAAATRNPVEVNHDLRLSARRAALADGDYTDSILRSAAFCETLIKQVAWQITWEAKEKLERDPAPTAMTVERLFRAKPSELIGRVLTVRLGGSWDSRSPDNPVGAWRHHVARMRNRIIHLGHRPTAANAEQALCAMSALEAHLLDRVAAKTDVYTRAAVLLAGKEGLEKRGEFGPARAIFQNQSLQELLKEYQSWVAVHDDAVLDD